MRVRLHPDLLAAAALGLLGSWFLWEALQLRAGPGYAAVGPRVFPTIVGLGILGSGLLLGLATRRPGSPSAGAGTDGNRESAVGATGADTGRERVAAGADPGTDWTTLGAMAVLLALYVALFRPLGFVVASTVFFAAGARVLGSRHLAADVAWGLAVSAVSFVVFTSLLGLELPAGPLPARWF